ncbi:hypothetical protein BofuT4_P082610.1 [Botrytis cinerea T4]|uniref:BTB domain-containing protein n=1 Tax=Botryotinia fuckeliana (strain T4) TaxID=999810 RepID=G2YKF4_BOTF4|nr:hypothetical protein BofuT4_P082610.1 [Botrytis cinerea T4]
MAQQNKKRKHGEDLEPAQQGLPSPIIFLARGVNADTRFTVFRQQFHLHSSGLKHHSNYFRKFLNSADKSPAPASALFKYDYCSVIDEDGSWALMPASDSPEITDQKIAVIDGPEKEIEAVRKLLCAIHSKRYKIETADELERLTRLADYHCALPVVSATLTGALFKSTRKLRNGVLFRECLIHTVGRWDFLPDPEKEMIKEDQELYKLVRIKLSFLYETLSKSQIALFRALVEEEITLHKIAQYASPRTLIGEYLPMYRALWDENPFYSLSPNEETKDLGDFMPDLLKNNLTLGCTGEIPGRKDSVFEHTFLCTEVEDDEFPWDMEEMDW